MKYLVMAIRTPTFDPQVIPAHYRFLDYLRYQGMLEQAGPSPTRRARHTC